MKYLIFAAAFAYLIYDRDWTALGYIVGGACIFSLVLHLIVVGPIVVYHWIAGLINQYHVDRARD